MFRVSQKSECLFIPGILFYKEKIDGNRFLQIAYGLHKTSVTEYF